MRVQGERGLKSNSNTRFFQQLFHPNNRWNFLVSKTRTDSGSLGLFGLVTIYIFLTMLGRFKSKADNSLSRDDHGRRKRLCRCNIEQSFSSACLSRQSYIKHTLENIEMNDCKTVSTPTIITPKHLCLVGQIILRMKIVK